MMGNHERFLHELEASQRAVVAVAEWARRKGCDVVVPPLRKAPTAADAPEYADAGDLFVDGKRIEVKWSKVPGWTCAEDWPFPDYLIEAEAKILAAGDSIAAYIEVNKPMTHAGVVLPSSRALWHRKTIRNPITSRPVAAFACPLSCVQFRRIR